MSEKNNRLFLLDAYALIYRAYYAFIKNPRYNSKGMNTSAIFGFTNTLNELLEKEDPTHIAVAFDSAGPTDRESEIFADYKANREEMPEDIALSIPYIEELIKAFNIPILKKEGYEADDIIGTIAKQAAERGYTVYMMTSDKDFAQLVSDQILMYKPSRSGKGVEVWGVDEVKNKFGVERPEQVIDILGLWGDAVDNIPGVPGVGEKRAKEFIQKFGSIDGVYENLDEIKGKLREKVADNREQAEMSRHLATIITDVPVDFNEEELVREAPDKERVRELFAELEFRNMTQRVLGEELKIGSSSGQMDMFGEAEAEQEKEVVQFDTLETKAHTYSLCSSEKERNDLLQKMKGLKAFCFDTETTGTNPHHAEIVGFSVSWKAGEAYYVPLSEEEEEVRAALEPFREVFEDPSILKIGHNIKYDINMLGWYGIDVNGDFFDTMVAHYLIQPEQRHKLDLLAEIYLNYQPVPITQLIGEKGKKQKNMRDFPPEDLVDYACEDADITLQLKESLDPELQKVNARELFYSIESPLIDVLSSMESEGVKLDVERLKEFSGELSEKVTELEKKIHKEAGRSFNINSPKQLGEVLFDELKIVEKPKKTKSGQYSTSEETLAQYLDKHPIIQDIFDVRSLSKLKSTYVDALPQLISKRTGRIHTNYNQAVTSTGRLSSNDPNLQNIPIRTEEGRKIREAFVPRDENHEIMAADYSQIELRIMASLSQDEGMLSAFQEGQDIHAATASRVYGVPIDEVSREQRRNAKTVNFGIIYGISAYGLSQRINISRKEAAQIIDTYFEQYPKVKEYMDQSIELARKHGYVETLKGRRRYLPDISSNNATVRGFAERNAINAPIQGSAADMIKVAMVDIHRAMKEREMASKMTLQVHDELVFDAVKREMEDLQKLVEEKMKGAMELKVPVEVEMGIGKNWLEAH